MRRALLGAGKALAALAAAVLLGAEALLAWAWLQGTLYTARWGAAENPYAAEDAEIAGICALLLAPLCLAALAWLIHEAVCSIKKRAAAQAEK